MPLLRLVTLLLCSSSLWLVGCDSPGVSGVVLPSKEDKTGIAAQQRIEVRLIRGKLIDDLTQFAAQFRQDVVKEAQAEVLQAAKAEQAANADALQQARDALAAMSSSAEAVGSDPAAPGGCLPSAEAHLQTADRDYHALLLDLMPRIAALGLSTDSPTQAVALLRASLQTKLDAEARRLRDEYIRNGLVQKSGTVLATGVGMDRLCWNVQNKRDIGVRFRSPIVSYNGKPLPDSVAQQIWGLPGKDTFLRIPNVHAANDVLLPGASFEACFYARPAHLAFEIVETYGLSPEGATRAGEWSVQWEEVRLVADPTATQESRTAKETRAAEGSLTAVFATQLRQFESVAEESRLIDALNNSDSALTQRHAEAILLACHRLIEKQRKQEDIERAIQAIQAAKIGEPAVQVRLRPLLQKVLQDPERLTRWIDAATSFVDSRAAARQDMDIGKSFAFRDLQPGSYSLLGQFPVETDSAKIWLVGLDVQGSVTQDLTAALIHDSSFRGMLENIWLSSSR